MCCLVVWLFWGLVSCFGVGGLGLFCFLVILLGLFLVGDGVFFGGKAVTLQRYYI